MEIGERDYAATNWTVKNLLELKNARRVRIDGNLFEHNWVQSQNGFAILFTVRNQDGTAPWSVVEDITFTNNIVQQVANGINILGMDDNHISQRTQRIRIANNLFRDLGGRWGEGDLLQLLDGTRDIAFERNTAVNEARILRGDGAPHLGFVFVKNIVVHNEYGIVGTDQPPGVASLNHYFPDAIVVGNAVVGVGRVVPRVQCLSARIQPGFRKSRHRGGRACRRGSD